MWFVVNKSKDYNAMHTHPAAFFSGVYYVKVPKKGNKIVFEDPLQVRKHEGMNCAGYEMRVKEGMFILFPSWLGHKVPPNDSDEERIAISINIAHPS